MTAVRQDMPVSHRVVRAVADELQVDPFDIDPLYDTIDPDALESLFQTGTPSHYADRVEFTIEGCTVGVHGTGKIDVTSPAEAETGSTGGSTRRTLLPRNCRVPTTTDRSGQHASQTPLRAFIRARHTAGRLDESSSDRLSRM